LPPKLPWSPSLVTIQPPFVILMSHGVTSVGRVQVFVAVLKGPSQGMSQDNVDIVESMYEAFNRGYWDAGFRNAHPDFELVTQPRPNAGMHRGRRNVQAFLQDFREVFDTWVTEPEQLLDMGDQVVAVARSRARPKGTSAPEGVRCGR
jgi:ketosteroid isomerase-like protein